MVSYGHPQPAPDLLIESTLRCQVALGATAVGPDLEPSVRLARIRLRCLRYALSIPEQTVDLAKFIDGAMPPQSEVALAQTLVSLKSI